ASRRDHLTSASLVDHPSRWRTRRTSITLLPYTTLFRSASRWPSSLRGKNFSPMNICRTDEAEFFVSEYLGARWLSRRAAHSVGSNRALGRSARTGAAGANAGGKLGLGVSQRTWRACPDRVECHALWLCRLACVRVA